MSTSLLCTFQIHVPSGPRTRYDSVEVDPGRYQFARASEAVASVTRSPRDPAPVQKAGRAGAARDGGRARARARAHFARSTVIGVHARHCSDRTDRYTHACIR